MPVIHPEKICIYPICSSRSEVLSPALIFNMGVFPLKTAVISLEPVRLVSPCFAVFFDQVINKLICFLNSASMVAISV